MTQLVPDDIVFRRRHPINHAASPIIDSRSPLCNHPVPAHGYFTAYPLKDLVETEAFLAYGINGLETPEYGYPLRLVAPGWVTFVSLTQHPTAETKRTPSKATTG